MLSLAFGAKFGNGNRHNTDGIAVLLANGKKYGVGNFRRDANV
jgi:hypothetical protein